MKQKYQASEATQIHETKLKQPKQHYKYRGFSGSKESHRFRIYRQDHTHHLDKNVLDTNVDTAYRAITKDLLTKANNNSVNFGSTKCTMKYLADKGVHQDEPTKLPQLYAELRQILHLFVHFVLVPVSFEVPMEAEKPELLQGAKGFDASREP